MLLRLKLVLLIVLAISKYYFKKSENDVANVRNDLQSFNFHLKTMRDPTVIIGGNYFDQNNFWSKTKMMFFGKPKKCAKT